MSPREASPRVAHQRICANAKTALDSLKGCTCSPSYHTFHRDREGRGSLFQRDRGQARRARRARMAERRPLERSRADQIRGLAGGARGAATAKRLGLSGTCPRTVYDPYRAVETRR